jgi:hypothetical protein
MERCTFNIIAVLISTEATMELIKCQAVLLNISKKTFAVTKSMLNSCKCSTIITSIMAQSLY